jgi:hypothetical protein
MGDMDQAKLNLQLQPEQLEILRRVLEGEALKQRVVEPEREVWYFDHPAKAMESVRPTDIAVLTFGEGPDLELLRFHAEPFAPTLVAELTDLGAIYALRYRKGVL